MEVSVGGNRSFRCLDWGFAGRVKTDIVNPTGEVDVGMCLLPWLECWGEYRLGQQRGLGAASWDFMGDGEKGCHLLLRNYGLGAMIDLQSHFKHQWRVLQVQGFSLESLKVDGVVESGHVHKAGHSILSSCSMYLLSQ